MALKRRGGLSEEQKAALNGVGEHKLRQGAGKSKEKVVPDSLLSSEKKPEPKATPKHEPKKEPETPDSGETKELVDSGSSETPADSPAPETATSSLPGASSSTTTEDTTLAGTYPVQNFDIIYAPEDPDRIRVLERNLGEVGMISIVDETTRIRVASEDESVQKAFDIVVTKTSTGIKASEVTMEESAEVSFRLAVKTFELSKDGTSSAPCELEGVMLSASLMMDGAISAIVLTDKNDGRTLHTEAVQNMKSSGSRQITDSSDKVYSVVARLEDGALTTAVLFEEVADLVDLEEAEPVPDPKAPTAPAPPAPVEEPVSASIDKDADPYGETYVGEGPSDERPSVSGIDVSAPEVKTILGVPERPVSKSDEGVVCSMCGREDDAGKFCSDCGSEMVPKSEAKKPEPKVEVEPIAAKPKVPPLPKPPEAKESLPPEPIAVADETYTEVSLEEGYETDVGDGFVVRAVKPETGIFSLCLPGEKSPVNDESDDAAWLELGSSDDATVSRTLKLKDGRKMTVALKRNDTDSSEVLASVEYTEAPKEEKKEEEAPAKKKKKKSKLSLGDYLAPVKEFAAKHWKSATQVAFGATLLVVGTAAALTGFAATAAALPIVGGAVLLGMAVVTEMYINKKNDE